MPNRTFVIYRDSYVSCEVELDEAGETVRVDAPVLHTFDHYEVQELVDGAVVEDVELPGGVVWPDDLPIEVCAGFSADLATHHQ